MSKTGHFVIGVAILLVLLLVGWAVHTVLVEDFTDDPRPCRLHGPCQATRHIRIRYGLLKRRRLSPEYLAACETLFPRAAPEYQSGGCTRRIQRWAVVRYCSDCEAARESWLEEHSGHAPRPLGRSNTATQSEGDGRESE